MANVKFTDLPNLASITASTIIPVVDANVNYTVTTANLQSYVNNSAGNITGDYFIGNGSQLTGIVSSYGDANVAAYLPTYGGNVNATTVFGQGIQTQGYDYVQMQYSNATALPVTPYDIGTGSWFYLDAGGGVFQSNTTGTLKTIILGNDATINADGNITAPYFVGNGSQLTDIVSSYGNANVATLLANFGSNVVSTTGNITGGNITAGYFTGDGGGLTNLPASILAGNQTGNIDGNGFSMLNIATITSAGAISAVGNITGSNITAVGTIGVTGTITATGNITGANINGNFIGSGAGLTGIVSSIVAGPGISISGPTGAVTITNNNPTPYGNANVAAYLPTYSGVLAGASLTASGNITGGNVTVNSANARVSLLGSTSNKLYFNTQGVGAPTAGTISPGAKLVLYDSTLANPAYGPYAIGIKENTMWFSTATTNTNYEFYQAASKIASIEASGIVTNGVTYTGTAGTAGQVLTTYANGVTYFANASSTFGNITTGTISASGSVTSAGTIQGNALIVTSDSAPASSGAAGTKGQIIYGNVGAAWFLYVCVANNTWRRVSLSSF